LPGVLLRLRATFFLELQALFTGISLELASLLHFGHNQIVWLRISQEDKMEIFSLSELMAARKQSGELYHEFLRVPAMSAGVYQLAAGGNDPQEPHTEDELYYIASGRAQIRVGEEDQAVEPGSLIFVAANMEHRFHSITEDLTVLVFFAPAEYSLAKRP
jgi:mannose-6-phosphate isomerase-like protein (cupin superfamily)